MPFDEGLTDAEVLRAETKYDIHFPDDLREFLQTVLPREAIRYIQTGALERKSGFGACCDIPWMESYLTLSTMIFGGPPERYLDRSTTISPVNHLILFNF
jgi:hypothetical protein